HHGVRVGRVDPDEREGGVEVDQEGIRRLEQLDSRHAGEVEAVPGSEIEYGVYGCTRGIQTRNEPETVGAGAAGQGIGAHAADERVVAGQPAQSVISGEAIDGVVGCSADKDVI